MPGRLGGSDLPDDLGVIPVGGLGSGNRDHAFRLRKKQTVEDCLALDTCHWMRDGLLKAMACSAGTRRWTYRCGWECSVGYKIQAADPTAAWVRLSYTVTPRTGDPEPVDYTIHLTTTQPNFGGARWWFVCPLATDGVVCGRRVGKLYLPPGKRYFGCRHCNDLTYASCQESHRFDGIYRHLARKLGCSLADVKRAMRRIADNAVDNIAVLDGSGEFSDLTAP
jgi:hypothetical protein